MSVTSAKTGSTSLSLALENNFMEPISSIVLGSASTVVRFIDIPQTYKHLQIRMSMLNGGAGNTWVYIEPNGTAPVYSHILYGDGANVSAGAFSNSYSRIIGYASGNTTSPGVIITDILDYANTNKNKTIRSIFGFDMNGPTGYTGLVSNLVNSTTEINSITISAGEAFSQYSRFSLYGIKG